MAVFVSHYKELGFYVNKEFHKFYNGRFVTEDKDAIKVLSSMTDAYRFDEPKAEEAPKPKAPVKKSSGK